MHKGSDSLDWSRRKLLSRVGTAGVGISGLATVGAAEGDAEGEPRHETNTDAQHEHEEIIAEYTDLDTATDVAASQAADVLTELVQREFIESATLAAFDASDLTTARTLTDTDGVLVTSLVLDGEKSAQIRLQATVDTATITLYVQPGFEKAFAIVEDEAADIRTKVTGSNSTSSDDVSTDHVEIGHCHEMKECEDLCLCSGAGGYAYYYEVTYECCYVPNGQECNAIDSNCSGCYCVSCC